MQLNNPLCQNKITPSLPEMGGDIHIKMKVKFTKMKGGKT
jgi:hypothetical protein